jgi:cobyrinic acid a,c-diamide synthase
MGLFDGVAGGTEEGSGAQFAKLLNLPVLLVLDASKSSRSIAAVVKGFETFDPEVRLAGIVLNGVPGESHFRILERSICSISNVPILGWLPREPAITIQERHLGLHTSVEQADVEERLKTLAAFGEANLRLHLLLQLEHSSDLGHVTRSKTSVMGNIQIRLGVARDRAFSFYYEDNFDLLRQCGAEIVEFSPLSDEHLPAELDGLYIGGGYPELYAKQLSENRQVLADVRAFAEAGKPIYAECGGMMYLAESLTTLDGDAFPMACVLPLTIEMTKKLVHFGYAEVEFMEDCLLGEKGSMVRGHSFHCSQASITGELPNSYRVRDSLSGREEFAGYRRGNVLASYIHLHFRGNSSLTAMFVSEANRSRQQAEVNP